jgi:hypothetical protein
MVGARNGRTTAVGAVSGAALAWIAVHYWRSLPDGIGEALLILAIAQLTGGILARDADVTSEQCGASRTTNDRHTTP